MKEVRPGDLVSAVPVVETTKPMTKQEKLLRWAKLVRESSHDQMLLWHNLERYTPEQLRQVRILGGVPHPDAFHIAASDPVFNADGLPQQTDMAAIMGYFDLTQVQLHAFSCDCGGALDKDTIATRIENFANGPIAPALPAAPVHDSSSWTGRFNAVFGSR